MQEIKISFDKNEGEDVHVEFGHSVTEKQLESAIDIMKSAIKARKEMMKKWIHVSSSVIEKTRYHPMGKDGEFSCVEITMNNENNYIYFGVQFELFQAFVAAASMGSFYNKHIKGQYPCTKLD